MAEMSNEDRKKILNTLQERGARLPCPRCGNPHFVLIDGYFNYLLSEKIGSIVLGGPSVPSIVTVCSQCGFLSQHALGALELLPPDRNSKE